VTVNTPFTNRPALPWLTNFRPTPLSGLADYTLPNGAPCDPGIAGPQCQDTTVKAINTVTGNVIDVFRVLHEDEPGMYTIQLSDGSVMRYRQPPGSPSLPVGGSLYPGGVYGGGPGVSAGVSGSSTGLLIAAAIVAALFFFGGRR
jgi:hypothetical protein